MFNSFTKNGYCSTDTTCIKLSVDVVRGGALFKHAVRVETTLHLLARALQNFQLSSSLLFMTLLIDL